ncbi:MAG TPA: hypothetical protein VMV72_06030 [Verrucomicrobiae bacterium]|nr:hypothetical protein [Verrucomicrobiae bacterium]
MFEWIKHANEAGIWDFGSFVIALIALVGGAWLLRIFQRSVRGLTSSAWLRRDASLAENDFPFRLYVAVANLMDSPVLITSAFVEIAPDDASPLAHFDDTSRTFELKFRDGSDQHTLSSAYAFLPPKQMARTYLGLNSSCAEDAFQKRAAKRRFAKVRFTCIILSDEPKVRRVSFRISHLPIRNDAAFYRP